MQQGMVKSVDFNRRTHARGPNEASCNRELLKNCFGQERIFFATGCSAGNKRLIKYDKLAQVAEIKRFSGDE